MSKRAAHNHTPECDVCCAAHDEGIHDATVSVHGWFRQQVLRNFVETEIVPIQLA